MKLKSVELRLVLISLATSCVQIEEKLGGDGEYEEAKEKTRTDAIPD